MNYSPDMRDRLYSMFMDRLVRIWRDLSPSFGMENGGFSVDECREIERRWERYLLGMGCSVQGWSKAMGYEGVIIRNPCESTIRLHANNPSISNYILMSEKTAEKILVLGSLP